MRPKEIIEIQRRIYKETNERMREGEVEVEWTIRQGRNVDTVQGPTYPVRVN